MTTFTKELDAAQKKREDILRKLKNMIAKAQGLHNPLEAAAFAAKAQEYMLRYNVSEEELAPTSSDSYIQEIYQVASVDGWLRRLLIAVGHSNFCAVLLFKRHHRGGSEQAKKHVLVGEEVNVFATKAMFEYLEATLRRLGIEGHNEVIIAEEGHMPKPLPRVWLNDRRRWVDNFYAGALTILEHRLAQLRRDLEEGKIVGDDDQPITEETGRALVLVKDAALTSAVDRFYPERGASKFQGTSAARRVKPGYSEGFRAGNEISLAPQISASTDRKAITGK